jgi:hypothetical protein
MTQLASPPVNGPNEAPIGKPLNTRLVAIGLLIATIIGYLAILIPIARRGARAGGDGRWESILTAIMMLGLGFVLAMPGVLWYRKRAATWATWSPTPSMPWLAWGPRLLVVCGLLIAGYLHDTLYWLSNIAMLLNTESGEWVRQSLERQSFRAFRSLIIGIGAAVCVIGLAGSATPEALSKWTHRAVYLLCAICVLHALAWPWTLIQQALMSGSTP